MWSRIQQSLNDPKQVLVAAAGLSLLGFYAFYARHEIFEHKKNNNKKNSLQLTLGQLVRQKKNMKYKKIAITETYLNNSDFTGDILSKLKAKLIAHEITTLVNCSPIKIFNAASQCFLETLSHIDVDDEKEYISYYQNASRCQLLMEKTIQDIEQIKSENEMVVILCDNNIMDLKVKAENSIWNEFLSSSSISEEYLMNSYDIVIHLQNIEKGNPAATREDKRITEIWKPYSEYYTYYYDHSKSTKQNEQVVMKWIIQLLKPKIPKLYE